jgi:type IV secretion system protein TrbG
MWRLIQSFFVLGFALYPVAVIAAPVIGTDGVFRYVYGERTPPTLVCTPLFVCDLALEPGEAIINIAVGDSVRWLIAPASSGAADRLTPHLLIKPIDVGLQTNLVVTTNRRTYEMLLASRASDPLLRVGFTYPQSIRQTFEAVRLQGRRARAREAFSKTRPEKMDFAYRISGDRHLQPLRVFNDGTRTYVQMPVTLRQLPVLFAVENHGSDVLVNYRFTAGHAYVIDGVPERMALVDGAGKRQRRTEIVRLEGAR